MIKFMKAKDLKFTHGKGHICNLCERNCSCRQLGRIKDYAKNEAGVYQLSIQIFCCEEFRRKEKS